MYREVKADEVCFDIGFKMDIRDVRVKDWRRIEGLVRSLFVTMCSDDQVELAMVTEKDIDVLRFFIEWEVKNHGRDIRVNVGGREFLFRKCKVSNLEVSDFKTYYDGDALSITVGMTHSGIAIKD